MELDNLYRRVIMDHYKHPRNCGSLEDDVITVRLNNPSCGDTISLQLHIDGKVVSKANFTGEGCSISISSASMMTEAIKGKTTEQALKLAERFSSFMQGKNLDFQEYEDIEALCGVSKFPARIKCATLAWNALKAGIEQNEKI